MNNIKVRERKTEWGTDFLIDFTMDSKKFLVQMRGTRNEEGVVTDLSGELKSTKNDREHVSLTARGKEWNSPVEGIEINWAAWGSSPINVTESFANMLLTATEAARLLEKELGIK